MFLQANQRASWRNVPNERWHKTILAGNETLPSPSQPVGATSVTLTEITHFAVGHAPPGQLKCFLASPVCLGGIYEHACRLSAAVVPLVPSRCPFSHCSWTPNPRDSSSARRPLPSSYALFQECRSCVAHAQVAWRKSLVRVCTAYLFSKGFPRLLQNPRMKTLGTHWNNKHF